MTTSTSTHPSGTRFARPRSSRHATPASEGAGPRPMLWRGADLDLRDEAPLRTGNGRRPSVTLLIFGVVFPAVVIAIELVTRLCTTSLFNPMPTPWHVALALALPFGNAVVWLALAR